MFFRLCSAPYWCLNFVLVLQKLCLTEENAGPFQMNQTFTASPAHYLKTWQKIYVEYFADDTGGSQTLCDDEGSRPNQVNSKQ